MLVAKTLTHLSSVCPVRRHLCFFSCLKKSSSTSKHKHFCVYPDTTKERLASFSLLYPPNKTKKKIRVQLCMWYIMFCTWAVYCLSCWLLEMTGEEKKRMKRFFFLLWSFVVDGCDVMWCCAHKIKGATMPVLIVGFFIVDGYHLVYRCMFFVWLREERHAPSWLDDITNVELRTWGAAIKNVS